MNWLPTLTAKAISWSVKLRYFNLPTNLLYYSGSSKETPSCFVRCTLGTIGLLQGLGASYEMSKVGQL